MKKFYLLLVAAALICSTSMAQVATKAQLQHKASKGAALKHSKKVNKLKRDEATPAWFCDFENGETLNTGNDIRTGKASWFIATKETYPETLGADGQGWYMQPFVYLDSETGMYDTLCETGAHWAMVDLISDYEQFGGTGQVQEQAWMEFTVDLSAVPNPKICFYQLYRPLNLGEEGSFIRVSIDGGATWTDHRVNGEIQSNEYAPLYKEVLILEAGGVAEVKIRFQFNAPGTGLQGYAWLIDDIKIFDTPDYNLTIDNARISMFGYIDYRNVPDDYWTSITDPAERRDYAYQLMDPYSQTPRQQWLSTSGYAAFNVEVTNNGVETVTPKANIKITNPSGTVVFDKTVDALRESTIGVGDTIDFGTIGEDAATSTVFFFEVENEEDIELGIYTAEFYVFSEGNEDADTADNTIKQYFAITENAYSTTLDEPERSFRWDGYLSSASGDEYGTEFTYYYQPDGLMTTDIYIPEDCTAGTSFQVILYEYDDDASAWTSRRTSEIINVDESMLNAWINVPFEDEYEIVIAEDKGYHQALISVRGIWDGDATFCVGSSDRLTTRSHSSLGCMRSGSNPDSWYYGYEPLSIKFRTAGDEPGNDAVNTFSMSNIEMFPNPTNGIVNFNNVENANIEVINMMGQVVANANNTSESVSIDLSNLANGNYVVRVVMNGEVATSKLNIAR